MKNLKLAFNHPLLAIVLIAQWIAAVTAATAHNLLRRGGLNTVPLYLCAVAEDTDQQILKSLGQMGERFKALDDTMKEFKLIKESDEERKKQLSEVQKQLLAFQKHQIEKTGALVRHSRDGISDNCAKYLAACYLSAALGQEKAVNLSGQAKELYEREIKSILGIEAKSALTASDIPLPTQYQGDIVELVYSYGDARRLGTVFPLGAGTVKLPRLTTDPAFTLNAVSAAVAEVSPQFAFATFTAEKFGGLIRLPSEIEEDSIVGMGQFLARYIARNMALCEDYQLFRSTGGASGQNGTAEGLTKSVVTNTQFVYNGGASNSGKTAQSDATLADFRTLRTKASGAVLRNAAYAVHPSYEALFSTFNTSATVTPYVRQGPNGKSTLDGFPIEWVPIMPAYSTSVSASLVHALFGDYSFAYLGVRGGPRVDTSREAGFTTDEILIRALQRMTTQIMALTAVAGLRNSAT